MSHDINSPSLKSKARTSSELPACCAPATWAGVPGTSPNMTDPQRAIGFTYVDRALLGEIAVVCGLRGHVQQHRIERLATAYGT